MRQARICFVASSPLTVQAFLKDYLIALKRSFDVAVIFNRDSVSESIDFGPEGEMVKVFHCPIVRPISPLCDIRALLNLIAIFRRERFDIVHSITPKAGLLAMSAAFFARIPVRIHMFTGQVWVTRRGVMRQFLKTIDRIVSSFATSILVDSPSQRHFLIEQSVIDERKSSVLANGAVCGVDPDRFQPNPALRSRVRGELGIGENDMVFLFVGRLTRDKGVLDLADAFSRVYEDQPQCHLLIVGRDEEGLEGMIRDRCHGAGNHLHFVPQTNEPGRFMAASDVLMLPSYREGFGLVVVEAAMSGIPAVGSRIYGIIDAIDEGNTGLLHEARNVEDIVDGMSMMIRNPAERLKMGMQARSRAAALFGRQLLTDALMQHYTHLLYEKGMRAGR